MENDVALFLKRIIESKDAYRRKLASLLIAEKLAMLEVLRDGLLEIREARQKQIRDAAPRGVPKLGSED